MKVPCCSVCQTRYNEEERVPLLLECGHGFCKECLSRMFAASTDTTLPCPRCRHVSAVGNSVTALRKNYAVLALLHSPSSAAAADFDCDYTDDDEDGVGDDDNGEREGHRGDDEFRDERCSRGSHTSISGGACGRVIEVGAHHEVKLLRKIGEGRRAGVDTWAATIGCGPIRKCKYPVAVKRVEVVEEMDVEWVLGQLDSLRRASMWCRNVCTFHGVVKIDGCLGLVMDRCHGSVLSEMQRNEGRLTLEQILRFLLILVPFFDFDAC
uniref:E3 ubiquitin-protein ligase KEG n=1 Tax=Rhizophora mucronata TaxID=61149 RepID=A0A2P2KEI2_RHIMU